MNIHTIKQRSKMTAALQSFQRQRFMLFNNQITTGKNVGADCRHYMRLSKQLRHFREI